MGKRYETSIYTDTSEYLLHCFNDFQGDVTGDRGGLQ
jgi:hypothetical protein